MNVASGTGSERAKVASVGEGTAPREPGSPEVHLTLGNPKRRKPQGAKPLQGIGDRIRRGSCETVRLVLRRKPGLGDQGSRLFAPLGIARGDDPGHTFLPCLHPER